MNFFLPKLERSISCSKLIKHAFTSNKQKRATVCILSSTVATPWMKTQKSALVALFIYEKLAEAGITFDETCKVVEKFFADGREQGRLNEAFELSCEGC